MKGKNVLVYDIEVLRGPKDVKGGWDNPHDMGFATAVGYNYSTDIFKFYELEKGKEELIEDLMNCDVAVSFNGVKFDTRVLLGNDRVAEFKPGPHWSHIIDDLDSAAWHEYDLCFEAITQKFNTNSVADAVIKEGPKVVFNGSLNLDSLTKKMFGLSKTGHGAHAPELYKQGNKSEVFAYNLNDVRLTMKLLEFVQEYRFTVDRDGNFIPMHPISGI